MKSTPCPCRTTGLWQKDVQHQKSVPSERMVNEAKNLLNEMIIQVQLLEK